jgi:hypothetical protein
MLGAAAGLAAMAQPAPPAGAIPIARIAYVDDLVEVQPAGKGWSRVPEGAQLRIGDTLRTGPQGTARIDFPWMSVAVAGASRVSVPTSLVLATVLEEGRVEQTSPSGEMIKLVTSEARIRGEGRLAVRREQGRTLVSAFAGAFRVESGRKQVALPAGFGIVVEKGGPRTAVELPPAPADLDPGDDPLYVSPNEPVMLRFGSTARTHHLQVLGIDSSQILIERDLGAGPATVTIPWPGTFRWRVAARDASGLEGPPSREGLLVGVTK